jgi:hypothetical protein
MSAHAKLGASNAKRWLNCTNAPTLEATFEDKGSSFAAEGTDAHTLGEAKLRVMLQGADPEIIGKTISSLTYHDQEMEEATDLYAQIVAERYAEAQKTTKDAVIYLEERLDYSTWVPGGFGTGDVVIIADGVLDVMDLKYGKGVPVDAYENPQLKLYGLGAWDLYRDLYDIHTLRLTIIQPRLDSVTTYEISVTDLVSWAEDYVRPRALLADTGEGEYRPGEWCQFCKAKSTCRARAEENLALAAYEFADPPTLTPEEIGAILGQVDQLTRWASDIKDYAQVQAETYGIKWPGWKLVEGRSNRKYLDAEAVEVTLKTNGYENIYKPLEIKGITEMEKVTGKKKFETILGALIVKPAGKPTLVPESDNRPEIQSQNSAAADFAEETED